MAGTEPTRWDAIVVGSGFGGSMVAHRLVAAGARVLMIERGDWVGRGEAAWKPEASLELTPHYATDIPYRCERGAYKPVIGGYACVGGPSVFYGCVSFRFRERDFVGDPGVVADSGAAWPYRYDELEPFYSEAEALIGVSGDDAGDPTAPHRTRRRSRSRRRRSRRSRSASPRPPSTSGLSPVPPAAGDQLRRRRASARPASGAAPATRTPARSRPRTTSPPA